mgnify:CR=1 FL=1
MKKISWNLVNRFCLTYKAYLSLMVSHKQHVYDLSQFCNFLAHLILKSFSGPHPISRHLFLLCYWWWALSVLYDLHTCGNKIIVNFYLMKQQLHCHNYCMMIAVDASILHYTVTGNCCPFPAKSSQIIFQPCYCLSVFKTKCTTNGKPSTYYKLIISWAQIA